MTAPKDVIRLVDQFQDNLDSYKSGKYNEAQLRSEFLDPLFKALGWDLDNAQGLAEAYKDVVHEDAIRIGGAIKAPDYCFRIGGTRKFFLEAKKPSIDIAGEASAAYQLRRYAWSAKLPLSILSDFEEFAVYDCRIKPNKPDSAATARVFLCRFQDYLDKWDWIASIFSKDAVLKGSFDKYAETNKAKRGTAEVDDDFLATIERWRSELARVLALRNAGLSQPELNFAVQRIIDRIIFLRISEDRGIESYGRLLALTNGPNIYPRLCEIFADADAKFNSGLFYFKAEKGRHEPPDELTLGLDLDDKLLRELLKGLYYPESPYEFTVISSDILGQVYEQFLGKVIRLTAGHHAIVEDKPEAKKAGGVYYTPTYIVDYIVRQTVGKLTEGKTPKQATKLRVLDPACGSGSFLINAYQYLLDWHRDWYVGHKPEGWAKGRNPVLVQTTGGWKLTIAERKRILLDNIYGVDIDTQAVEVTKLSLLLKVLEGESEQTIQPFLRFFQQRALPDLGNNIKCGNSLIGPDFYQQKELPLLSDDDRLHINVFDWDSEFSEIIKSGGFDAVIGNPPWGATFTQSELNYLRERYSRVVVRMIDSYIYFIDRAIQLSRAEGFVSFIIPSTLLNQLDARLVRQLILNRGLTALLNLGQGVFGAGVLNTSTIFISGKAQRNSFVLGDLKDLPPRERPLALANARTISWAAWRKRVENETNCTFFTGQLEVTDLLSRLRQNHAPLSHIIAGSIQRGVSPDIALAHVVSKKEAKSHKLERELLRRSVSGPQIKRYRSWKEDQFIIYTSRNTVIQNYPHIWKFLERFRDSNSCVEVKEGKHPWWSLHRPRDPQIFASPKFVGLTTSKTIELIYDPDRSVYVTDAMYVFNILSNVDPWAFMAVMQSKLFLFIYKVSNQGESRVIPQVKASKLENLPFPVFDKAQPVVTKLREQCQQMYYLNRKRSNARTPQEQTALERETSATDKQINQLVYRLYGLTEEEIKIVEGSE